MLPKRIGVLGKESFHPALAKRNVDRPRPPGAMGHSGMWHYPTDTSSEETLWWLLVLSGHLRVDLGGRDVGVSQKFLNLMQVGTLF